MRPTASRTGAQLHHHPLVFVRRAALDLWVHCSHWELDAKLADGVDPASDLALAARAAQLVGPRSRRRVAGCLRRLVNECERGRRGFSAAAPVAYDQVEQAGETFAFLADILSFAERVRPRGMAMLTRLLFDGGSLLYARPDEGLAPGLLQLHVSAILDHLVVDQRRSSNGLLPLAVSLNRDSHARR